MLLSAIIDADSTLNRQYQPLAGPCQTLQPLPIQTVTIVVRPELPMSVLLVRMSSIVECAKRQGGLTEATSSFVANLTSRTERFTTSSWICFVWNWNSSKQNSPMRNSASLPSQTTSMRSKENAEKPQGFLFQSLYRGWEHCTLFDRSQCLYTYSSLNVG